VISVRALAASAEQFITNVVPEFCGEHGAEGFST
jgi:hypothetical protein